MLLTERLGGRFLPAVSGNPRSVVFYFKTMASPQIENGYTKIANELIKNGFMKINLSAYGWRVLWTIIAHTYGFNKKETYLSFSDISKATGIDRRNVVRAINELIKKNIIIFEKGKNKKEKSKIQIQKNYELWQKLVSNQIQSHSFRRKKGGASVLIDTKLVSNQIQSLVSNQTPVLVSNQTPVDDLKAKNDNEFHDPKETNINKPGINKPGNKPTSRTTFTGVYLDTSSNISPPTQPSTSFSKKEVAKKKKIGEEEINKKLNIFIKTAIFLYQYKYKINPALPKYIVKHLKEILTKRCKSSLNTMLKFYVYFLGVDKFNRFEYWQDHSFKSFVFKFDNVVVQARKHKEEWKDYIDEVNHILNQKAPELTEEIRKIIEQEGGENERTT